MNCPNPNPFLRFSIKSLLLLTVVGSLFGLMMRSYGVGTILPWVFFFSIVGFLFLIGRWLAIGVKTAAANDPTAPRKIETFSEGYQADVLVSRLAESGVRATAVGGFVSGFQAESPGYVDVVVANVDYRTAVDLLTEWANEKHEIESETN